jgi:hypothetical protein
VPQFCLILTKLGFSGQIFVEVSIIEFHANPSSRSLGEMCEREDGRTDIKPIGTSGDYAKASTNISPYIKTLFYLANIIYRFLIASLSYKV